MTDLTLYGLDDNPAHLTGYGPIPAPLARRIAAGQPTGEDEPADGDGFWPAVARYIRRLYQKPGTPDDPTRGLIAMDSRRREFPSAISRFIVARDQFCRTPWCGALIRHTDHITPAADGGPTSAANAQGLCEACNYAKEAPGWHQAKADSGAGAGAGAGDIVTITPTGHRYTSSPPPPPGVPTQPTRQAQPSGPTAEAHHGAS